jgi:cytochrome c biogenesis protein
MTSYPDGPSKVLGFLSYDVLLGLQLDHVYRWAPGQPAC